MTNKRQQGPSAQDVETALQQFGKELTAKGFTVTRPVQQEQHTPGPLDMAERYRLKASNKELLTLLIRCEQRMRAGVGFGSPGFDAFYAEVKTAIAKAEEKG